MSVLVCGGRNFTDSRLVWDTLTELSREWQFKFLIHGDCPTGVDRIAVDWVSTVQGITEIGCPADWKTFGRAAGPIRNQLMIDKYFPDRVIAFPGGRGTADMVRRARVARIYVVTITARR
jgi:hypothetical protein